jgi:Uma2 family endonuclease
MTQPAIQAITERPSWTTADLELLPDDGSRYEIIDGELFVTRAPHWGHQETCVRIASPLHIWSQETGSGRVSIAPGIIFSDANNVIPDVVWASNERLALLIDKSGHLTAAPELIVEVLSPGVDNERRDRDLKLKLYSTRGVREYWVIDWRVRQIEVYRRSQTALSLVGTLLPGDELTTPLLPGFSCPVSNLFSQP